MVQTFVADVITGNALLRDIDAYVERWHNGAGENMALSAFLGLTLIQYVAWVREPSSLETVVPRPTVPAVLPRVRAYRDQPGNSVGGRLHLVLDGGNTRDSHVQYCLEHAKAIGDTEGAALARILLRMSKTQRGKLASLFYS